MTREQNVRLWAAHEARWSGGYMSPDQLWRAAERKARQQLYRGPDFTGLDGFDVLWAAALKSKERQTTELTTRGVLAVLAAVATLATTLGAPQWLSVAVGAVHAVLSGGFAMDGNGIDWTTTAMQIASVIIPVVIVPLRKLAARLMQRVPRVATPVLAALIGVLYGAGTDLGWQLGLGAGLAGVGVAGTVRSAKRDVEDGGKHSDTI